MLVKMKLIERSLFTICNATSVKSSVIFKNIIVSFSELSD